MNDAIAPSLSMLLALRGEASVRRPPKRAREGASGAALSPLRGRGMEYAESREYAIGDDARHMDWRVTARSGRPHTKLFQPERERATWIVADRAPALYFGTRVRYKSVQAARLGASAAWSALNDGDRIGAVCGSASEPPRMPASGMRGVLPVLEALVRWYSQADQAHSFERTLLQLRRMARPGSRIVVLADPASVVAIDVAQWRALAKTGALHVLMPSDAFEQSPPRRRLRFLSADMRSEVDLGGADAYRRWQACFAGTLQQALTVIRDAGGEAQAVATEASASEWLTGFRAAQAEVA
ncbi:hypothetical protein Lysil_1529 [Lysobacter silvestris]|uniref:DUF58 domain-containing protein n=1 Tax=Solilutibacter silvestris TaxID=1645665 RepID=A0A2K1PX32_9GAMM|nr:DUF58 domain-containing protein [Lysobacter silvestris]PNS07353.1 hypothetical protein Lysil_1529 [Lysobacter silvestris]